MTAVAERIEPPELFEFFVEQRAAMGLTIVPLDGTSGSSVMATLRAGGLVGLLCDRDIGRERHRGRVLRRDAPPCPAGPATLALRTGATLCTGAVYSGPGRDHRALVEPPLDTTRQGSAAGRRGPAHPGDRHPVRGADPPGPRAVARLPAPVAGRPTGAAA